MGVMLRRSFPPGITSLSILAAGILALALLPLGVLVVHAVVSDWPRWENNGLTGLLPTLSNTLVLVVGVATGTLVLGTLLAWLVTHFEFPMRRWFDRLLFLPLAVPGFIMGFVYVALFEYAGPVQTTLRSWFGWERGDYFFPDIATPFGLILVLTLVLYPYVYLLARAAFLEQASSTYEAAYTMGYSRLQATFRLGLPLALPQILTGLLLVVFETITDYGTVSYFSYPTLSERIIVSWNSSFDPTTAVQLSLLMMGIALFLLAVESRMRARARFYQSARAGRRLNRVELRGAGRWLAVGFCALILLAAFVLPVSQLVIWAISEIRQPTVGVLQETFLAYTANSFVLAAVAAGLILVLAMLLAYGSRAAASQRSWIRRLTSVGYAVPGAVVAVGVLVVVNPIDAPITDFFTDHLSWNGAAYLLTGTTLALMYGYLVRFLGVGYKSAESSLEQISPSIDSAAKLSGAGAWRIIWRIHAPLVRTGLAVGMILVFVDVMKELPATLLLRPFGMDTLALRTYFLSVEGWHRTAAIPALTIVLIGLLPVLILMRVGETSFGSRRGRSSRTGDEVV